MLALFHEHYKVRYVPRGLGSWLFYIICLLILLVAPVFIGLGMGGFWLDSGYLVRMPYVRFTNRCVLRYTTVLGQEKLWTCSAAFNEEFIHPQEELTVMPFFSIYENDLDTDDHVDSVTIVLSIPINDLGGNITGMPEPEETDAIDQVEFLPEFTYEINDYILKVNMTAAPLLTFKRAGQGLASLRGPLSALTEGDLVFHTTEPLIASPYVDYTRVYTDSPFDNVDDVEDVRNVPHFAAQYSTRNQSLRFRPYTESVGGHALLRDENYDRVLGEDLGGLGDFTWRVKLRILRAEVSYVPSIQEALKWAWVQYFCIAVILQWLLWNLRGLLVKEGIVGSIAIFHRGWRQH
ncbi:hypothetical protein DQ04_01861080 [Trypanosoma grayi]|uniref:hypothetical protein n=1 Tax=Trypanosoma grayi TaxID=71804 RepID=UPI0004F48B0A|nr:hypothetical protein DQ04_01861080 [Trypanosoma grayi]KEG12249.1 hypothetical protein DQ04_01861080 [Trypanosoma grayi]